MRRWLHGRFYTIWWIIRHDSTAFTEWLSGVALVFLRGLMLLGVRAVYLPIDVRFRLYDAGITENRWATYLMFCGLMQVILAGSSHYWSRLLLKVAILSGFAVIASAFILERSLYAGGMVTIACMMTFYFVLMIRIFIDRRRGVKSLEERLGNRK